MLVKKFDYQPIARTTINGTRYYATPDGKKLPSVTSILEKTKPAKEKQALHEWRRRVGEDKAQAITSEAANRGTRMHTYLENYIKTGQMQDRGSNPFSWASHAMANTVIEQGLKNVSEVWGVEVPLYFPSIYAGTTDGIGVHNGEISILDYKQTNKPKREEWIDNYKLQLAAYAEAHNEVYKTNITKGVVLMCVKPQLDEQQNLVSKPQYQEFVISGEDFEYWRTQWWARVEMYYLTC